MQVLKLRQSTAKSSAEILNIPAGTPVHEAIVDWAKEHDVRLRPFVFTHQLSSRVAVPCGEGCSHEAQGFRPRGSRSHSVLPELLASLKRMATIQPGCDTRGSICRIESMSIIGAATLGYRFKGLLIADELQRNEESWRSLSFGV